MFTGIVEGKGKVVGIEERPGGRLLRIDASSLAQGIILGGSVSVNGCCTTVVKLEKSVFSTELMEITLQKTNLGDVKIGSDVNLERPMKLGDELGGHLVQGHVDGVGVVVNVTPLESSHLIEIRLPADLVRYVVATGSVSVNGVSMTIADIQDDVFTLGVIPHTWEVTNFSEFKTGVRVNIEVDLVGKYIEKLLPQLWKNMTALPIATVQQA
jgi:riboflavin synthase